MNSAVEPRRSNVINVRLATAVVSLVAFLILGVWLWSRICRFPSIPWNDVRLAPSVAFAQGLPVFPPGGQGVINTWLYGPLSVLYFWPATWAPSAAGALMVAAGLNLALTLVPLAFVCFAWPAVDRESDTTTGRLAAFLLCMALWPERHYSVYFADNLAIACGLIGNLVLVRARDSRGRWLAATVVTAAIACKQISIGLPLAQIVWLGFSSGLGTALRHAARCAIVGAVIAALAMATFGGAGLWFVMVELPSKIPWDIHPMSRLRGAVPEFALQVILPVTAMILGRRFFRQPGLLLPALAWACSLPMGIFALFKFGGWLNSLHSLVLWLPPVLTIALTAQLPERRRSFAQLGAMLVAAALVCDRVIDTPNLSLRPQIQNYDEAAQIAVKFPGRIWFPMHPLVTLYSERRYYHDEDGLFVRRIAHLPVPDALLTAHLPPALCVTALDNNWSDWGIARSMQPQNTRSVPVGNWTLLIGPAAYAPR